MAAAEYHRPSEMTKLPKKQKSSPSALFDKVMPAVSGTAVMGPLALLLMLSRPPLRIVPPLSLLLVPIDNVPGPFNVKTAGPPIDPVPEKEKLLLLVTSCYSVPLSKTTVSPPTDGLPLMNAVGFPLEFKTQFCVEASQAEVIDPVQCKTPVKPTVRPGRTLQAREGNAPS